MACKLLTICALVCAIQGLNAARLDISMTSGPFQSTLNYLLTLEKEYSGILDTLQNVMYTDTEGPAAEFAESLGNVMDTFDQNAENQIYGEFQEQSAAMSNVEVVAQCIQKHAPAIVTLRETIMKRIEEARASLRQLIIEVIGPYVTEAKAAFNRLTATITGFPAKVFECIKNGDFLKILEVIKETLEGVRAEGSVIAENLHRARQEFPAIRERARTLREQIQTEARAGIKAIHENMKECVKNGGSNETPSIDGASRPQEENTTVDAPV